MKKSVVVVLLLFVLNQTATSQGNLPFWKEVQVLKQKDSLSFPAPGQVLFIGENDFASSDTVTVSMVMERFTTFYTLMRARYPKVPFLYVSMKPSPSRVLLLPKYQEANKLIAAFLKKDKMAAYADVYSKMVHADGSPMEHIFLKDRLHMNAEGYAIWKEVLERFLIR